MDEILSYRQRMLDHFAAIPDKLIQAIQRIPPSHWHTPLQRGSWSTHQTVVHLRDAEAQEYLPRLKRILSENQPILERFNHQDWMAKHYQPGEPMTVLLETYHALHRQELNLLADLKTDEWSRPGRHPVLGIKTLQWWVERSLQHTREHITLIQNASWLQSS